MNFVHATERSGVGGRPSQRAKLSRQRFLFGSFSFAPIWSKEKERTMKLLNQSTGETPLVVSPLGLRPFTLSGALDDGGVSTSAEVDQGLRALGWAVAF